MNEPANMEHSTSPYRTDLSSDRDANLGLRQIAAELQGHLRLLVLAPVVVGAVAVGVTYLIAPTFTAVTTFMPPQQAQSAAASALASLSSLGGLAGSMATPKNTSDQYVALMQSVSISDRIVDQFNLLQVYDLKFRVEARHELAKNVRIAVGRKDGLVSVEVDDEDPKRAAEIANRYVDELRRLTSMLAVTEAQQRRVFFEQQLQLSRQRLVVAQKALQASGFNAGALKAEPRAAAEAYAKLRAEATAAEIRLQTLRGRLADGSAEVQQQLSTLGALRDQLKRSEQAIDSEGGSDYVSTYREFKYQETLFELNARQFELARVDESREGAIIQVVDLATPPEKRSKPKRVYAAAGTVMTTLLLLATFLVARSVWRRSAAVPNLSNRPLAER